jgi:hypothetical protein
MFSLYTPRRHRGGTEVQRPSFTTLALNGGKWSASCHNLFTVGVKTPSTLEQQAGWAQPQSQHGHFGQEKSLSFGVRNETQKIWPT